MDKKNLMAILFYLEYIFSVLDQPLSMLNYSEKLHII